jgi:Cu+-exporting ATPase
MAVLAIASVSGIAWWLAVGPGMASMVFSAVLIVACPCALALSAPFTFGNFIRRLAAKQIYFKDAHSAERLSAVDSLVFDKTGTLTRQDHRSIHFQGLELSPEETDLLRSTVACSLHPLSRAIHQHVEGKEIPVDQFHEKPGHGIEAQIGNHKVRLGRLDFVTDENVPNSKMIKGTEVHLKVDDEYKGYFVVKNEYRPGAIEGLQSLQGNYSVHLLSGDRPAEEAFLRENLGSATPMAFEQLPQDKLSYIKGLESSGHRTVMLGDGLNDAGALRVSTVGVSVVDQVNTFTPASDVIMQAEWVAKFNQVLAYARDSKLILKLSLVLSLIYNLGGLTFAIAGILTPLVAAILMPLSSITVVLFVTGLSNLFAQKRGF